MISKLNQMFGQEYEFTVLELNKTLPSLSRIRTRCKKHDLETDDLFLNMLHKPKPCLGCLLEAEGTGITIRQIRRKRSVDELIEEFKAKHGTKFMYHDIPYSFTTMKDFVWIKCVKHNHFFKQSPVNHLNTQICCPICYEEFIRGDDT